MSFRVPTPAISVVDLTVRTNREASYKEIAPLGIGVNMWLSETKICILKSVEQSARS